MFVLDTATILLIAFGLAMDALAVSLSTGLALGCPTSRNAATIGGAFGLFQAAMPVIGWSAGSAFKSLMAGLDHWVAFGLLSLIGCKMVFEAVRPEHERQPLNPLDPHVLLVLSLATSIDALAVGLSLAMIAGPIWYPAAVIGVVAGALTLVGTRLGTRLGTRIGKGMEIAGGVVLIIVGIRIVYTHLVS